MLSLRPDPHPLDYDWRFSANSSIFLSGLCAEHSVLCLGTPSVANILENALAKYLLIDRHPIQNVSNHSVIDINVSKPNIGCEFEYVVIDPPWYLDVYYRWLSWAANSCTSDGTILLSIWPDETRPSASREKKELFNWIKEWGQLELFEKKLTYVTPEFEKKSFLDKTASKVRYGDLLVIKLFSRPKLEPEIMSSTIWHRYIFDNYQLAVKMHNEAQSNARISKIAEAEGWIWPSVSKRAHGRDKIQLWSSDNEVAMVSKPGNLKCALDKLIDSPNSISLFTDYPELMDWNLPKPPYKRTLKWIQNC
nr:hypothetical protein [uncultured Pantoea sp.]